MHLAEGAAADRDGRGLVKMHLLRVDLTRMGVSLRPLMRVVAERLPLTRLAAGHKNLVAAVNTGYFDFATGAPTQPLIVAGRALVATRRAMRVVGVDARNRFLSGSVSVTGAVVIGGRRHQLSGVDAVASGGLVLFDSSWGTAPIPLRKGAVARQVIGHQLGPVDRPPTPVSIPRRGFVLVAGPRVASWLSRRPKGASVHRTTRIDSSPRQAFEEAYGVGTQIVVDGHARTGLACNSAGTSQPARTAIGTMNHDKTLLIGEVEDHPGTRIHGLDEDQMSAFMRQGGAQEAWDFDGSGSTELLARWPHRDTLSLRTYPADGTERPMPVGLGVVFRKKHERAPSR
ncbi:MAG TPA: phosphodiester glycosidase family protein [Mycobacteriales bacterium]|nr:phosphodiester glycosidase family protein [Mycobacteriales bacterium]